MDQQFIELFDVSRVVYDPAYLPDWPETTVRWSRPLITDSSSSSSSTSSSSNTSSSGGGVVPDESSAASQPPQQHPQGPPQQQHPQATHTLPPRDGPDPLRTPSPMVAAS